MTTAERAPAWQLGALTEHLAGKSTRHNGSGHPPADAESTAPQEEIARALDIAHALVDAGIPVFVAKACPPDCRRKGHEGRRGTKGDGLDMPSWSNPREIEYALTHGPVNRWQPGDGLFALMGRGLDLLDCDPRNGSEPTVAGLKSAEGMWPTSYGHASTPSGGSHDFIRSLKMGSKDGFKPGLDLKGDGGIAWIAPTVKRSKTTGELTPYRWVREPDLDRLKEEGDSDDSGGEIAFLIHQARGKNSTPDRGAITSGTGVPAAKPEVTTRVWELRDELANHPRDGRANQAATRLAHMVGQYVGAGQIDQAHATEIMLTALQGWTYDNTLGEKNMVNTIIRQIAEGAKKPRTWEARSSRADTVDLSGLALPEWEGPWPGLSARAVVEDQGDVEDVPDIDIDAARAELAGIKDLAARKTRAREIARDATRATSDTCELGEWRDLLKALAGLSGRDFDEMTRAARQDRKRAEKAGKRARGASGGAADVAPLGGRPLLEVSNDALAAEWLKGSIGTGPLSGLFLRGDLIVRTPAIGEAGYVPPVNEKDEGSPAQIRPVDRTVLASVVSCAFTCYKTREDKDGELTATYALFPKESARVAVDVPDKLPNLRELRGVVHTPTIRADGSLLNQPGYDSTTRLLYLPEPGLTVPPVPERPTSEHVREAVALLDHMVGGFRFLTEHDKANYYGYLITPLLRAIVPPPYKLVAIGAPMQGSGKTLMANVGRILHGGVFRSEMPEDDAELRKVVTSILDTATGPVVIFDNVSGVLRSSALAGLLSSGVWSDRRLGGNETVSNVPNDRLWTITGNNLSLGGDLVRRTLWITIDPAVPDPHLRTGFAIPDLEGWARENRGKLLHALLIMVRAWVAAGRPTEARGSDSFSAWIAAVSGILAYAGVPGQFDAREAARQTVGEDDSEWREFLEAVEGVFGSQPWTCGELLAKVNPNPSPLQDGIVASQKPIPITALPDGLTGKFRRDDDPAMLAKSLGKWLGNRNGRWAGGLASRSAGENRTKTKLWKIERSG